MLGYGESHREGEAGTQGRWMYQSGVNPPGADRDLSTGRGRQRGDERMQNTAAHADTRREAQR